MKLTVITKPLCPYCTPLIEALIKHRRREDVELTYLYEDQPEAQDYDFYYLPAVFLDGRRIIHGKADPQQIRALLEQIITKEQA